MPQQKATKTIDAYLNRVIQESLKSQLQRRALQEKEQQAAAAEPSVAPAASDDEKEKLQKGEILPSDIIEKLNTIRSGKSFKDQQISASLEEYVGSMTKAEKTALFAFLKGISQIVTGEISGESAVEPADKPADVEMEKTVGSKKVSIKPVIIKKAGGEEKKKDTSKEDTTGPVPITPKAKK